MFRRMFGFGLLVLLIFGLLGGLGGRRSRAAYYEGYAAGLQAQSGESVAEGAETAAPPPAPHYDGYGRAFGWGILGIFAIFFKVGFFFLMLMLFFKLLGFGRWRRRGGRWGRGPWGHHKWGHGPHHGKEKSPQWMDDRDDDEPIMTV